MSLQALSDVVELFLDGRAADVTRHVALLALLLQQHLRVLYDLLELLERLPVRDWNLGLLGALDRSQRGQDGLEALYQAPGSPPVLHDIALGAQNSVNEADDGYD